jgi:hypothetical protein
MAGGVGAATTAPAEAAGGGTAGAAVGSVEGAATPRFRRGAIKARSTLVLAQKGQSKKPAAACCSNATLLLNQPSNVWPSPQRRS